MAVQGIKSTATIPEKPFPKLMAALDKGYIVLFFAPEKGVTVAGESIHGIGHHSDSWAMHCFRDYEGTVTLQNA